MFSENTYEEFVLALKKLLAKGIDKLIIDVRDNPGGYMEAVAKIADEMIAGEHILVSTRGKNRAEIVKSKTAGIFENNKVAILVNENSASASEILAGVIQDMDRGIVVGRRTYGKGLVQEQFELPDHAALRITTARYYLPSNRCIQRSYADGKTIYKHDIEARYIKGELTNNDSIHNDKLQGTFYTIKKRKVHGGEGISPDFFVAIDTSKSATINYLQGNHLAANFATDYYFKNKNSFQRFDSAEKFATDFTLNDSISKAKIVFLKQFSLPAYLYSNKFLMNKLDEYIKAEFAKLTYGYNGYYAVMANDDDVIKKAIKELK
jgi:carboxyl-terminal processing protease